MPSNRPAAPRRSVTARSCALGVGSPLGWLCATTSAAAPSRIAGENTSRGCTGAASTLPAGGATAEDRALLGSVIRDLAAQSLVPSNANEAEVGLAVVERRGNAKERKDSLKRKEPNIRSEDTVRFVYRRSFCLQVSLICVL